MLVKVYISEPRHESDDEFWLLLPAGPFAAIPLHLQDREWRVAGERELNQLPVELSPEHAVRLLRQDGHVLTRPAPPLIQDQIVVGAAVPLSSQLPRSMRAVPQNRLSPACRIRLRRSL